MKRNYSFVLFVSILLTILSFNLASAVQFQVTVTTENGYPATFIHPDDYNTYWMANTDVKMRIGMGNNSGVDIYSFVQTMRIYSLNGDGTHITWNDVAGSPVNSVERINGWEDSGPYWDLANDINVFSWDGSLPDTISHIVSSSIGWPDGDPLQSRLELYMNVPVGGASPQDAVTICIEQSDGSSPEYDWLFPDGSEFWPYCFDFLYYLYIGPSITNPAIELTTSHFVPFDESFGIENEPNSATNVIALDENDDPIGTITFTPGSNHFNWFFDPPCTWINDGLNHVVKFYLEDAVHGHLAGSGANEYTTQLTVTDGGPPEISGLCGVTMWANLGYTYIIELETNDPDGGDDFLWSWSPSPTPDGDFDIVDGTITFRPCVDDEYNGRFNFAVYATDCLGRYDECEFEIDVIASLTGDVNFDGDLDILDAVYLINYVYKDGPAPPFMPYADWNLDGNFDILDIVMVINCIYKDGPHATLGPIYCN